MTTINSSKIDPHLFTMYLLLLTFSHCLTVWESGRNCSRHPKCVSAWLSGNLVYSVIVLYTKLYDHLDVLDLMMYFKRLYPVTDKTKDLFKRSSSNRWDVQYLSPAWHNSTSGAQVTQCLKWSIRVHIPGLFTLLMKLNELQLCYSKQGVNLH